MFVDNKNKRRWNKIPRITWSKEQLTFLQENFREYTDEELANLLNHSPSAIETKRHRLGLFKDTYRKYTFNQLKEMLESKGYEVITTEQTYKGAFDKIQYICPIHRNKGVQGMLAGGIVKGNSCWYCAHINTGLHRRLTDEELKTSDSIKCDELNFKYIETVRVTDQHGHSIPVVRFICKNHANHGIQEVMRSNLHKSQGCKYCAGKMQSQLDVENKISDRGLQISLVEYNGYVSKPNQFQCNQCGYIWEQKLYSLSHCPRCESTWSSGEQMVAQILEDNNIQYVPQYRFDDCKYKGQLSFDFYLPEYNICIEYHGKQHYVPIEYFGGQKNFETQIRRDNIKKEYCNKNNILLIDIPYTYNSIDTISQYLLTQINNQQTK